MFSGPLHPLAVHFPIVLGLLLPILALSLLLGLRLKAWPRVLWGGIFILTTLFMITTYVAMELGEQEEQIVATYVPAEALEDHEEQGELVWYISVGLTFLALSGFAFKDSRPLTIVFTVASFATTIPLLWATHQGQELVYRHGAAEAYSDPDEGLLEELEEVLPEDEAEPPEPSAPEIEQTPTDFPESSTT